MHSGWELNVTKTPIRTDMISIMRSIKHWLYLRDQ